MTFTYSCLSDSPLGSMWLAAGEKGLLWLQWGGNEARLQAEAARLGLAPGRRDDDGPAGEAVRQLAAYFAGERQAFALEIDWSAMAPFQAGVLQLTAAIPFGQVRTYGALASALGLPAAAARAVGRVQATNPLPIIIPCHRVVGADGSLRGYGGPGGIRTKAWLLALEGRREPAQLALPLAEERGY